MDKLNGLEIKIVVKFGEGDKLFGFVSNVDFVVVFVKEGVEIEKKYISIVGGLIKCIGKYDVIICFYRDVIIDFFFDVVVEVK